MRIAEFTWIANDNPAFQVYQHQTVLDQEEVNMEIWDTAGHFHVMEKI